MARWRRHRLISEVSVDHASGPEPHRGETSPAGRPPTSGRSFFISYSRHNRDWADWVSWELEAAGHSVNVQHWDSVAGTSYLAWIETSIRNADHIVVLLSEAYLNSAFGQTEFLMAYQVDPSTAHRRVIPIRVENCEPPRGSYLAQLTYFDLFGMAVEKARRQLVESVEAVISGRDRPKMPPVFPGGVGGDGRPFHTSGTARLAGRRFPVHPPAVGRSATHLSGFWSSLRGALRGRAATLTLGLTLGCTTVAGGLTIASGVGFMTTVFPAVLGCAFLYFFVFLIRDAWPKQFWPNYAANDLEVAVRGEWTEQIRRLQLNRNTLSVRWTAAPSDLCDDWETLIRVAHGPGRPEPDTSHWFAGPHELVGGENELAAALDRIPTRRLVVLGGAGSGKTTMLIRLVVDRLATRQPGAEVPVLISLSTWDPAQDLFAWLEERLIVVHPYLMQRVGPTRRTMARELIEAGKILPVLDGLDEMPEHVRPGALAAINHALLPGQPLVLSSRMDEYRAAIMASGTSPVFSVPSVGLDAAAGVELRPVDPADVRIYLRTIEGRGRAAHWDHLLEAVTSDPTLPAAQALMSPLMIWLARTAYAGGSGRESDLVEVLDQIRFPDRGAVERHLLSQFVAAAYRDTGRAEQAERSLRFLARHLRDNCRGMPDLFWWELPKAVPTSMLRLLTSVAIGVTAGCTVGSLFGLGMTVLDRSPVSTARAAGMFAGLASGLATGLLWLAASYVGTSSPAQRLRWRPSPVRLPLMLAVGGGVTYLVALASGLAVGVLIGVVGAVFAGVQTAPVDPLAAATPQAVFARDRATFVSLALVSGTTGGVTGGLGLALASGSALSTRFVIGAPAGLLIAAAAGPCAATLGAVWGWFTVVRAWLAFDRQLPLTLFRFLEDACGRGVLRQVGVAYQFRHIDIQNHLAPPQDPPGAESSRLPTADRP
ncbi:TIR domain-containing protein [Frankia sp. Mgl5]|uniref:TIR domain-containing protein n=1 Tax=Frankia sp. Mgl5 TaxID=2933793 RepID=UPI002010B813|nr:toll/interleukin-1 receptor domain-containing protein [Frankia sp. Mgl5]MCK9927666.1 TIR domain-containing protein [Frankia sp. Mgl5]